MATKFLFCLLMLFTVGITACVSVAPSQLVPKRFFWPQSPAEPKIEWIGTYASNLDLRPSNTSIMAKIVGEEDVTPINYPLGIASDSKGKVFVVDTRKAQVIIFDFNDKNTHILGGDLLSTVMQRPVGVTVDSEDMVYVGDSSSRKIYVVNPDNKVIKVLDASKFVSSIGYLAADSKNKRLIIPDPDGDKISVLDFNGKFLFSFGTRGSDNGEFNRPNAVVVDKDGIIVVADSFNARVQRFNSEGKFLNKFGRRGDSPGDFAFAKGIAMDSEEHIYVTDGRLHKINIYTKDGQGLMSLGEPWSYTLNTKFAVGGFLVPQGIFIDKNDRVYVADQQNNRFHIFQYLNKSYLDQHPILNQEMKQNSLPQSVIKQ